MKSFWKHVDKVLLGSITVLVFLAINILCWIFNADYLVPMWVLILVIIGGYLICIAIYGVCITKKDSAVYRLPKVKSITKIKEKFVFIVEKNDLFNQGSYATICYQDDDDSLEIVLGLGYVQSVTAAGTLQVVIEKLSESDAVTKVFKKIENTAFYKKSIKIKPSIHKELLKGVITDG